MEVRSTLLLLSEGSDTDDRAFRLEADENGTGATVRGGGSIIWGRACVGYDFFFPGFFAFPGNWKRQCAVALRSAAERGNIKLHGCAINQLVRSARIRVFTVKGRS